MIPALLITFRELLEASLIVATIIGILTKTGLTRYVKAVWQATYWALAVVIVCLGGASLVGMEVRGLFDGPLEPLFEGSVMIISAFFVTWAVFFLHKTFAKKKLSLLQTVQSTINTRQKQGIMSLVFFAVLREGLEIVLFLSTIFFSSTPVTTGIGFALGAFFAIGISYLLFTTTIRIPVFYAFRFTTLLLILFAAGMFAQGYHELAEVHVLPSFSSLPAIPLPFLPDVSTVLGSAIKSLFGLTKSMHPVELSLWVGYTTIVGYLVLAAPLREESEE